MKRKIILALPLFVLGAIIYIYKSDEPEISSNKENSKTFHSSAVNNSIQAYSSVAMSSSSRSFVIDQPWVSYSITAQELEQIGTLIGYGDEEAAFQFIKIDPAYLDKLDVGDIVELTIPGAPAVDMNITNISNDDVGRSVVGHLSGYSAPYYIGFTYDKNGGIYGDLATERDNYSIRTFYGKSVIFRNWSDPDKKIFDSN